MESEPDYERPQNHVYENGTPGIFGRRVLPSLPSARAARGGNLTILTPRKT